MPVPRYQLFIENAFVPAVSGETFTTIDPATEEIIGEAARGGVADVDRAVKAAATALRGPWREITPYERGRMLFGFAGLIAAHRDEFR